MSTQLDSTTIKTSIIKGDDSGSGAPLAKGYVAIAMSDANLTLSAAQMACPIIKLTGTLTAGRDIIAPLVAGAEYTVINGTGQTLTVKGASGTGIAIATNKTAKVMCDGTNYVRITADV